MKQRVMTTLLVLSLLLGFASWNPFTKRATAQASTLTYVLGWGRDWYGNLEIPADLRNIKAIAAGQFHNLALKNDGTVVAWGSNFKGEASVPPGLNNVIAIAVGDAHSVALKSDGSVVVWGGNSYGQRNVPTEALSGVTAIAANNNFVLALKSNGTVIGWGDNYNGQTSIPDGLTGVVAIAAGGGHGLVLKSDGTLQTWGRSIEGQLNIPTEATNVKAISAGETFSVVLKNDGTVIAWGASYTGVQNIPSDLGTVTAIDGGGYHVMALRSNGTIKIWGSLDQGQGNIPSGLGNVKAISAGLYHSLVLVEAPNTAPTINGATITRTAGSPSESSTIATVNDLESSAKGVTVSIIGSNSNHGVTVTNLVNTDGTITADVVAACGATQASFLLRATDSDGGMKDSTLQVNITPNPKPTLSYPSNPGAVYGTATTVSPLTGPSDNVSVQSINVQSILPSNPGGITVGSNGVVNVAATVPANNYTIKIRATDNCGDYTEASFPLGITRATPVITWNNPGDITYGTALGSTQLNATANVAGSFSYSPAGDTLLNAGNGQTLSVTFTPDDTTNYTTATKTVSLNVLKATPALTWNNPADIIYGTALSALQLNATANIIGGFSYSPASGTVLNAGNGQTLSVTFTPDDTANYNTATKNVSLNVLKATPTLTWNNPADIFYGTPLGNTQLNATANVIGMFSYNPANGTLLNAGNGQTLAVTFTPNDSTNYTTASKQVTINVLKATPVITWNNPANIVYGTALSATQLNASANTLGLFSYTPAAGTVLQAGNGQSLSVTFTPSDTANYVATSKTVALNVEQAPLTVTGNNAWRNQGAANPPFSGTIAGLKNGDVITATYSTTATTSSPGGTYPINATLNDPNHRLGNYQVINNPGTLTVLATCSASISPMTLPTAALAQPYAAALTVVALNSTVAGAYSFSHVAGTLPPGLSLVNTAGAWSLRGTPNTPGTYNFTLLATRNAGGCSRAVTYTLTLAP